MADLYKGIAGSPITYLAADISASQTTISVSDDSALPDGPNICTIGYGENLETIKYETKSNGVLQNVTRGVEGTPRAWQKGTEVARFFTAYDHNAIIENFNSHLAESANMPEIVTSQKGTAVKFPSGFMVCLMNNVVNVTINAGAVTTQDWTYPERFVSKPTISLTKKVTTNNAYLIDVGLNEAYTSSASARITIKNDYTGSITGMVDAIAIGEWK